MKTLNLVWLTLVQLVKQVGRLPQTIAQAGKRRQRQAILDEQAAERRDRILNPSKYLGK